MEEIWPRWLAIPSSCADVDALGARESLVYARDLNGVGADSMTVENGKQTADRSPAAESVLA